jgi:multisubunit Na+/H+ antiporter MnhE subunit
MLNIFNLFLFLLTTWAIFMVASGHLTLIYIFFGIIASSLVAVASARLKLIEKNSELLYLSFGFYRHFLLSFVKNFISSLTLIVGIALGKNLPNPTLHKIRLKPNSRFNPALLIATINMSSGLFCVDVKDNEITIHALKSSYFKNFDLQKICLNLRNINDDNII